MGWGIKEKEYIYILSNTASLDSSTERSAFWLSIVRDALGPPKHYLDYIPKRSLNRKGN